jgi:hypothetical protein
MTARFERLSIADGTLLAAVLAILAIFLFPTAADASESNKTSIVLEIKSSQPINLPEIPTVQQIADALFPQPNGDQTASLKEVAQPAPLPETVIQEPAAKAALTAFAVTAGPHQVPPKKTGDQRVYMHEPEIRAYVCPKLGDKCNTFIAILKAENGTHECTRDNRGLNRNGSIDIGLTQINWTPNSPYSFEQLQDCKFNLDIALKKYETRGFQPWAAYNSGRYLRHLPAVLASAAAIEAAVASAPLN